MLEQVKWVLLSVFGNRVAFHDIERMLYSSDLANLPATVQRQIVCVPDAVVQPKDVDELKSLVKIGAQHKIPLVPRGAGTAGYGGAVPTRGGIVADLSRLKKIIEMNKEAKTAVVEPGVAWNELEVRLRAQGLALRLYPRSAISATVGGWIANGGGIGIGSFEYGYIRDNIVELEIITPKGTRTLNGEDIDLVYGLAGTTGFISKVTLKVRDAEDDIPVLGAFSSLAGLLGAFKGLTEIKLPLWDVSYKDPRHVKFTHQAVEKQAKKYDEHSEVKGPRLPEGKYIAMFVYPRNRDGEVKGKLFDIIEAQGGEVLSEEMAKFEWDERFYPMRLKALGPSMIPSEVVISTDKLSTLASEVTRKIKGIAWNGTLVNGGKETSVLTYILDDERRRGFMLASSKSFVPVKAAMKLGGRVYTIGMILTDMAELTMGKDKLLKAYQFKKEVDPDGIMNPGKVFPVSLDKGSPIKRLNQMLQLARRGEWALRTVDKLFGGKSRGKVIGQKTAVGKLPFGELVQWDAFACANCGYCRVECPLFNAVGWESASPRGKFHFLREYLKGNTALDERMAEMFFVCTSCQQCNLACQVKASIDEDWGLTMRPAIRKEGYQPPIMYLKSAHNILVSHNPSGAPQEKRKDWMTPDLRVKDEGETGYWAGCAGSFTYALRNLPVNTVRILNQAGIEPVYLGDDEWCCGGTLFTVGATEEALETVKHNIEELNKRGIKTLITSCSGCWWNLTHLYPRFAKKLNLKYDIKVKHITEFISELIEEGKIKMERPVDLKVTYHDGCHIGRGGGIYDPPRKILAAIPGLELVEMPRNREHAACCGKHAIFYAQLAKTINHSRVAEAEQTGAEAIVCSCQACESNFHIGVPEVGAKLEVLDITDLIVESMGLPTLAVSKLPKLLRKKKVAQLGG